MRQPQPLFLYFHPFQTQNVGFSGIRTLVIEVEGEHTEPRDNLNFTNLFYKNWTFFNYFLHFNQYIFI